MHTHPHVQLKVLRLGGPNANDVLMPGEVFLSHPLELVMLASKHKNQRNYHSFVEHNVHTMYVCVA